jgi:ABC-type branched-subunit amino acid transport system permease subunit
MTRVYVFCISAFLAGVGGALLAGVSQAASGSPGGTYDYTISLIAVAVLGFCGRRLLFSPFLAAFLYEVVKIYPGFNNPTVIKYQGAIFGIVAMVVALAPGFGSIRVPRRSQERADRSPVTSRGDLVPSEQEIRRPSRQVTVPVGSSAAAVPERVGATTRD